jgi:hypothetical protein
MRRRELSKALGTFAAGAGLSPPRAGLPARSRREP